MNQDPPHAFQRDLKSPSAPELIGRRLSANFHGQPVGFVLLDKNGVIRDANHRFMHMLGFDRQHLNGNFSRLVHLPDLAAFFDHLRRARREKVTITFDLLLRTRDGFKLPVELISSSYRDARKRTWFRTCVVDTTERRVESGNANQARYRYQSLLDTVEGIVWEGEGPQLDITFVSAFAEQLLGYPSKNWFAPGFWETHIHFEDRDDVMRTVTKALLDESNFAVDYRVFTADRRVLWLHDTVKVTKVEGKLRWLGVAVDITHQKETERKLESTQGYLEASVAQRTAELRETITDLEAFSYSMSHDLRAPLRAIQGYSELLHQALDQHLNPVQREFFERIKSSTTRMDTLIQDVLTYSRVARAPLQLQPVDVAEVVENVIRDYPGLQRPHADIQIEKPLITVSGHPAFLSQCVSNLLWNAVKFMPPGQKPCVRIRTVAVHQDVEIWFEDNGIGIAPENQKRIFGIFQRLNADRVYEGTGIGLAIVQKAVERMGGRVGVESEPGQGSKFWLRLHGVPA